MASQEMKEKHTPDVERALMQGESILATYSFGMSVLVEEHHYVLTHNRLIWLVGDKTKPEQIALKDIIELKLKYAPSRYQLARCSARLVKREGGSIDILSSHYAGFADFEDRTETYEPFIRALGSALAKENPAAKFPRGYERSSLLLGAMLGMTGLAFVAMLLPVVFAVGLPAIIPLGLLILFSGPAAAAEIRRNWPGAYDPHDIPGDLLPSAKTPPFVDPALAKIVYALMRR